MGVFEWIESVWGRIVGALAPGGLSDLAEVGLKFGLAVVLAGILGVERERKGRAAGLRTHILVCLGATLMMVVADLMARNWAETGASTWLDKGRVAAGIITGIGFLGAGTIITVGGIQRGLTTAAMIWFVAALGIALGAGYYLVAVAATATALVVVLVFGFAEVMIPTAERFFLTLCVAGNLDEVDRVRKMIGTEGYRVRASSLKLSSDTGKVDMTFEINVRRGLNPADLVEKLRGQIASVERVMLEK